MAVCQDYDIDNEIIPRIASCFGGGMGNTGSVCGAVTGALMALGLILERGNTIEEWLKLSNVVQEMIERFESEMKTINCRELTGADLSTEKGREAIMNSDVGQKVCIPAVALAYNITVDLLHENKTELR